jgi:type IV fimbrial biogenesis protein FimT
MNARNSTPGSSCSFFFRTTKAVRRSRGFTLLEMLVTLVVAMVLLSIAVPSFSRMIDSVKLSSATDVFVANLHLARGEAIKRNSRVALCKSGDGVTCASGGGWEQGWIVFHDADNDGLRGGSETIIRRELPLSPSVRLSGNQNVARYVSFAPSGATLLVGGAFQAGTLTVCRNSLDPGEARQIILNAVGRPRIQKLTLASCD